VSEPRNDGGPAFPFPFPGAEDTPVVRGMCLRDYFAAKAMPTVMTASDIRDVLAWANWCDKVATTCYELADAMLKARAQL
jgi:hypothetical protein